MPRHFVHYNQRSRRRIDLCRHIICPSTAHAASGVTLRRHLTRCEVLSSALCPSCTTIRLPWQALFWEKRSFSSPRRFSPINASSFQEFRHSPALTLRHHPASAPCGQKLRFCPIALPARFACALYGAVGRFRFPALRVRIP